MSLPDSNVRPQYGLLVSGIFFVFLGVFGICTGEAWVRFGRVRYRKSELGQFWQVIVVDFLGGLFLIGYFLYKVYGISN